MLKPFEAAGAAERPLIVRPRLDQLLIVALLPLIFAIRVVDLGYNTLFVDEAIYATVGRDLLAGAQGNVPLGWMYGSYIYPALAGLVDGMGGVTGLRLLSAALSTVAAALVYLATVRLFGGEPAVWATLIFGLTAISINTGQLAVYDAPVVPALAAALYLIVRAAEAPPRQERLLLVAAGLCLMLAILTKYFAALFLPMLCCVGLACALHQGRSLRSFVVWFLAPMAATVGAYALITDDELRALFAGAYGVDFAARALILRDIWAEIGVTTTIALAGLVLLARGELPVAAPMPRWRRLLWATLVPTLAVAALAAPIYHLASGNGQSAWKHSVYSLIFLAPLAGYACSRLVGALRELPGRPGLAARVAGALLSTLLVVWGLDYALDRNNGFQRSWPNVAGVVDHLRASGIAPGDPVLAEGAQIYDYYLDFGPAHATMWTNTWYTSYGGREGVAAMEAAIADRLYRFVVLDGYYTPELRARIEAALERAGYIPGYEERQDLSLGFPARLTVYHRP